MSIVSEAHIQFELYKVLKNLIEKGKGKFKALEFTDVKSELNVDGGFADLVLYGKEDGLSKPLIVIETKHSNIDPWSHPVINQAANYALHLGSEHFITTNGKVLVSWKTFVQGVPLPERRVKPYNLNLRINEETISRVLEDLDKIKIGAESWSNLDEVFLKRLQTFHDIILPYIERSMKSKLDIDVDFKKRYEEWLKSQFFDIGEETNRLMSSQAAYLLMNRVLFYKTLEGYRTDLPRLHKLDYTTAGDFTVKLRQYFTKVLDINYKAIFEEEILNEIPIIIPLAEALNVFIEELDTYNLAKIQSDVIGRVYEDLIPTDERHRLGQYYTPPPIIDLIVEMTIKNPNDTVIDPGCGSGGFLVKAYNKLKELKRKENPLRQPRELHEDILDQLWGIDINQFPAHLAAINLAVRNLEVISRNIQIVVSDFFKVNPDFITDKDGKTIMIGVTEATTLERKDLGTLPLSGFDVVVTNPPYTRQEEMEYKERIRDVALTYSDGSKIKLGAQAGIYAYFFTHSAKFLKNGGRMGYITSNTWLDVKFGRGLKKFFLDNFKILAIIEHDAGVFEKANVDTCVVILEKVKDEDLSQLKETNFVKFVRIKKSIDIIKLVELCKTIDKNFEDDSLRIVLIEQNILLPEDKWGRYIRAPTVYYKILDYSSIIQFSDIADIKRGFMTGANEFFILDDEKIKLWALEDEYLFPFIKSPKDAESLEIRSDDIKNSILMIREDKNNLKEKRVLNYIEQGEEKGYHFRPSMKSRSLWYDLGRRDSAPILLPYMIRGRARTLWNKANAYCPNVFHEATPKHNSDTLVLLGILNSTLSQLMMELQGRLYGSGLLKIETYEWKRFPIINPKSMTSSEKGRIEKAFIKLCTSQRVRNTEKEYEALKELDDAIFDALGLSENERKQVYDGLDSLRNMRLQRKQVKVLVETEEGWKPPERHKVREREEKEPSKRLDMWV